VRFWDTSALVPLLVDEAASGAARSALVDDPRIVVWWATTVECVSAVGRRERMEPASGAQAASAYATLERLTGEWTEMPPTEQLRDDARRLVRIHDLRAADAFQLAAARVAADGDPGTLPFVTLDERLALAASREGFPVLGLD
jgi:predicted nucleic acid-binding protein